MSVFLETMFEIASVVFPSPSFWAQRSLVCLQLQW